MRTCTDVESGCVLRKKEHEELGKKVIRHLRLGTENSWELLGMAEQEDLGNVL